MYIIERLIGVGVYCFFLLIVYYLLANSRVRYKTVLCGYTFVLCVMGFFYKPYITADLYRIYETVQEFATWDFGSFFDTLVVTSSIPVARIYFWLIGKTGIPQLLPVTTCLICFYCIFYILLHTASRYGVSRKNFATTVLFFMSTGSYMMLISNIRTILALCLVYYCFYRESVEKKKTVIHILLYLVAAGMHNMAVIMIALRFLAPLFNPIVAIEKRIRHFLGVGVVAVIAVIAFQSTLLDVWEKFSSYVLGEYYSYIWEYLISLFVLISEIYVLKAYKKVSKFFPEYFNMKALAQMCIIAAIILCFEFSVFYRLITCAVPLLAAAILMVVLQAGQGSHRNRIRVATVRTTMTLLSMCTLFLVCFRGSLCSLKFFIL